MAHFISHHLLKCIQSSPALSHTLAASLCVSFCVCMFVQCKELLFLIFQCHERIKLKNLPKTMRNEKNTRNKTSNNNVQNASTKQQREHTANETPFVFCSLFFSLHFYFPMANSMKQLNSTVFFFFSVIMCCCQCDRTNY